MKSRIVKAESLREVETPERCFIAENWSSEKVSVARAKVKPGTATIAHHLEGVDEIYLIVSGKGLTEIGLLRPTEVRSGDTVFIPAGTSQKITNIGKTDLIFYCICTPRFTPDCYHEERNVFSPIANQQSQTDEIRHRVNFTALSKLVSGFSSGLK